MHFDVNSTRLKPRSSASIKGVPQDKTKSSGESESSYSYVDTWNESHSNKH